MYAISTYRYVYVNAASSTEESGVVCLKVECAVNDIACLMNLTKSVQWQHVSLPSIDKVSSPIVIVDVQTAGPTDRPAIADLYPTSFDIIAGNDDQLFDVVDQTSQDVADESFSRSSDTEAAADDDAAGINTSVNLVSIRLFHVVKLSLTCNFFSISQRA